MGGLDYICTYGLIFIGLSSFWSKTISSLQQKARETRYKNRLEKMESKTMSMLVSTGLCVMILLVIAILQMMGS